MTGSAFALCLAFVLHANRKAPAQRECRAFVAASQEEKVPLEVLLGVGYVESRFKPDALSKDGCLGVMQINPRYFPASFCIEDNIKEGAHILASLKKRKGTWRRALAAYYGGDNKEYAERVLKSMPKRRKNER